MIFQKRHHRCLHSCSKPRSELRFAWIPASRAGQKTLASWRSWESSLCWATLQAAAMCLRRHLHRCRSTAGVPLSLPYQSCPDCLSWLLRHRAGWERRQRWSFLHSQGKVPWHRRHGHWRLRGSQAQQMQTLRRDRCRLQGSLTQQQQGKQGRHRHLRSEPGARHLHQGCQAKQLQKRT